MTVSSLSSYVSQAVFSASNRRCCKLVKPVYAGFIDVFPRSSPFDRRSGWVVVNQIRR